MTIENISKEQEERLLLYATYTILYLNDTACFSIQQLGKSVGTKDKESKKIYGALLKRATSYNNNITKIVSKNMDYYCDYCSSMDDICDAHYFSFKNSLFKAYKDYGISDYEYFSEVETMRSMIELSVEAGRKIISDIKKHIPKVEWLEQYLLLDIMRVANNFANWSYRKVPKDVKIDFNLNTDVMISFHKLSECIIDYNSFDKSYRNAIKLELERQ